MWRHGIVYVLLFFSSSLAYSQCLESELAAPQSNVNAYYGAAVAIDGDRAVVGANERAAVYRLQGAQWLPEAVLAVPDADGFASSVALDDDVLVCGAHVFRRSGNAWAFDGELTPGDSGSFGSALAIDAGRIVVGAPNAGCCGAAHVYRHGTQGWVQEAILTPPDGGSGGWFGSAVDIDADRIVVGRWSDDFSLCGEDPCSFGSVYVFRFDGIGWPLEQQLVAGPPWPGGFGASVSISDPRLVIGTRGAAAYAFMHDGIAWRKEHFFDPPHTQSGGRVVVRGDFALLADEQGAFVFAYDRQAGAWRASPDAYLPAPTPQRRLPTLGLDGNRAILGTFTEQAFVFNLSGPPDSNANHLRDDCESDCNQNGMADATDIFTGDSADCDFDRVPDDCQSDCDANGIADECDLNRPDILVDCNNNSILDTCDIAANTSADCSGNGRLDECEPDCNGSGEPDSCDIHTGASQDVDFNGVPDECDLWSQCVAGAEHFAYGPHRLNPIAEWLAIKLTGELRAPDAEYERIDRDMSLLESTYPIPQAVHWAGPFDSLHIQVNLNPQTSHQMFDAMNEFYQVVDLWERGSNTKELVFCDILNTPVLAEIYESLPEVVWAWPVFSEGDGGAIKLLSTNDGLYVYEYSNGAGDCMNGCYCRQTWRFEVSPSGLTSLLEYSPGPCNCGDYPDVLPNDGDFDGDGLIDCQDPCPAGEAEGPADADGDGVGDLCDGCLSTVQGAPVDLAGCPTEHPADADRDGDAGLDDFAVLQSCLGNPLYPFYSPRYGKDCYWRMLDDDSDMDLRDFAAFQRCFSGTGPRAEGCEME